MSRRLWKNIRALFLELEGGAKRMKRPSLGMTRKKGEQSEVGGDYSTVFFGGIEGSAIEGIGMARRVESVVREEKPNTKRAWRV